MFPIQISDERTTSSKKQKKKNLKVFNYVLNLFEVLDYLSCVNNYTYFTFNVKN